MGGNMSEYNPDKWEIVRFVGKDKTWYKVLGGWSGGYLDGDSWRLSSGLEEISDDGSYYIMKNYSGSIYKCHKGARGMNVMSGSVYADLIEQGKEHEVTVDTISVKDYLEQS